MIPVLNLVKHYFPQTKNLNLDLIRRCSSCQLITSARERLAGLGDGKVHLEIEDDIGIATIVLDNPQKRNALSGSMMVQLESVLNELNNWKSGKGVILLSKGEDFCSGGDLTTVHAIKNPDDGLLMSTFMHRVLTNLYCLPFITVTLVQGKALGGGAELTTATDFRIFTESTEISFVQAKMGVVTGWGGGTRLVKLVGASKALDLLSSCRKVNGNEGFKIGIVDHIVKNNSYIKESREWLSERINHHHSVIQATKRIVISARDENLEQSLINERQYFSPLWGGPANIDALQKNIKHR